MRKTLTALAVAAAVAVASAAAPSPAEARCFGCAVGAGVLGGVVAGAIVGGAIANGRPAYPAYAPVAGYEAYGYDAPVPVGCPGGYWARRPLVNPYGQVVGYSRPRF